MGGGGTGFGEWPGRWGGGVRGGAGRPKSGSLMIKEERVCCPPSRLGHQQKKMAKMS